MANFRLLIVLSLAFGGYAGRSAQSAEAKQKMLDRGNSMIAKVIEMLGEEKDKIKTTLADEAKTMAEYMEWCDDTQTELSYAIKTANTKIGELTAVITDNGAQINALDEQLVELGNEIAARQSEIEESEAVRTKEHEEFLKAEKEQVATVEELEEMQLALKQQMEAFRATPAPVVAAEEGAEEALIQIANNHAKAASKKMDESKPLDINKMKRLLTALVNAHWSDPDSKRNIATLSGAFVQEDPAGEAAAAAPGADAVAAQDASNQANLAAFEGLKGKAEESLQRQRDEETKKQGEHDIQIMTLKQQIALAENNVDDAKKERARLAEEKADAEKELADVEASKAADEKSLEETTHECDATSAAWASRQSEAAAEMSAIEKAKEILASRVTVLIQVKARDVDPADQAKAQKLRQNLVKHFRAAGNKLHSMAMLNLVSVAAHDPMENVKNMLTELIAKLEKEAAEAASLHQFCQEEKKKTSTALKKKEGELDKLDSRIESAEATKQELEEAIATTSEQIAAIDKTNAEATKLRNEEHENYVKVDTDFTQAAEAVDDAIDALKEYYGDLSLLQTTKSGDDAPPTFGGAKKDSAGGIMGILETMGEEFRKTVKENSATEREATKAYKTLMQENKVSKSTKEAEIKGAESQLKSLAVSLHDNGEDLKMVEKEKGAILDYIAKLKPQCEGRVVSYAERKAKMEAEINGLKEGLAILEEGGNESSFSFLQVRRHLQ